LVITTIDALFVCYCRELSLLAVTWLLLWNTLGSLFGNLIEWISAPDDTAADPKKKTQ